MAEIGPRVRFGQTAEARAQGISRTRSNGVAPLWRHNASDVLRYLVVDELHTFDGAQGTDLACLIRRLRARIAAESEIVCVGTSATLGGEGDRAAILVYASGVFHQPFSPDAVVGEVRQGIDEFLADAIISSYLVAQPGLAERMDPARYVSVDEYIRGQHELFFGEAPAGEPESLEWRLALGRRLREHASFVNLLRVLEGSSATRAGAVLDRLQRSLPVSGRREAERCLRSLCALISVAREREGTGPDAPIRPFLNVKLHLWVRELRRMVCSLHEEQEDSVASAIDLQGSDGRADSGADPGQGLASRQERPLAAATVPVRVGTTELQSEGRDGHEESPAHRIRYADDLKPDEDSVHLPLIQCRECHVTGWGCVKHAAEHRVGQDLRVFYNRFFPRDVDVSYLFPLAPDEQRPQNVRGTESKVCGRCGYLLASRDADVCPGCGLDRLTRVFRPDSVISRGRGKSIRRELSRDCTYCGAREALIILGARASSLLSTALAQLYASRHNDDRKVIAFSDNVNVQDAAHRGSFFAARTWRNGIRAAIAQVVARHEGIALGELPDRVVTWWGRTDVNPAAFDAERFISEFIAPDRLWLRDFEALRSNGALPAGSTLLSVVQRRVRWDALAELTFGAAIGRTLERTHTAAVGVDRDALEHASKKVLIRIRDEFGELRTIDDLHVRSLVLGILRRMKDCGAVASPMLDGYLRSGGNPYAIRDIALQDFGPRSALPVFPAPVAEKDGVEALAGLRRSWYQTWVEKVLTPLNPLAATRDATEVLHHLMNALCDEDLVTRLPARRTKVWALNPARYYVTTETAVVHCAGSSRTLVIPDREADLWHGIPCLDLVSQDHYVKHEPGQPTWAGRLYGQADIRRIVSAEHTALVSRPDRDRLQERFAASDAKTWEPNLLSATPTLELGVDIGDLSTVVMCSVPPAPVNYLRRTGRAGRRDGNALTLTVATGQPHDLYFYAEPMEMLGSRVDPPGIFLNAPAVLARQLTAFCLDCWVAGGVDEGAVPRAIRTVLNNVERRNLQGFPYPLFDFISENRDDLLVRFFQAFESRSNASDGLDEASRHYLGAFLHGTESHRHTDPIDPLRVRILKRLEEVARDRQSLRNDVETLGRRVRALERGPSDETTRKRIKELTDERR